MVDKRTKLLTRACKEELICEIYYRKPNCGIKLYEVEPYEIKNGYAYCFDVKADTIKRFSIHNIEEIGLIKNKKWNVPEDHMRKSFKKKLIEVNDGETE
jgi:predicted DNA-binding transcriptional regulator YafY